MTAKEVAGELRKVKGKPITLRVNSLGGDVFQGVAIYNLLSQHDGEVSVMVDGVAASAASIVAMAGSTITMGRGAEMMIHDPWVITMGNSEEHGKSIQLLEQVATDMVGIYTARTGLDAEEVRAIMRAETWYTADDAVARGFASATTEQAAVAACGGAWAHGRFGDRTEQQTQSLSNHYANKIRLTRKRYRV